MRTDPVVRAMKTVAAVMVLVVVVLAAQWVHRDRAMADLACPPQDHAVWDGSLGGPWWWKGEALCGSSLTVGAKVRP